MLSVTEQPKLRFFVPSLLKHAKTKVLNVCFLLPLMSCFMLKQVKKVLGRIDKDGDGKMNFKAELCEGWILMKIWPRFLERCKILRLSQTGLCAGFDTSISFDTLLHNAVLVE